MKLKDLKKRRAFVHSLNSVPPRNQMQILKHLDSNSLEFLTECLSAIVKGNSRHLRLKDKNKKKAQKIWAPYQKTLKKMSNPKYKANVLKGLQRQTGEGFLMSAVISSVIPLIASMINKLVGKK